LAQPIPPPPSLNKRRGSVGREGLRSSLKSLPPLLFKERRIKGVRLINNLQNQLERRRGSSVE
jgi:hypothetical protein